MKRILPVLTGLFAAFTSLAQNSNALKVEEFTLRNGFKVYVNEDHLQPRVFGAVVVKAGSNDCPDTGIAHYFEHMMFKGTPKIGTVDYDAEKVYLDSISLAYDKLALAADAEKSAIQQEINRLSAKAAEYAIPNEFDRLIARFGGSRLNAGTSYDFTVYYNTFAPKFVEQWAELYYERFRKPVFRLFQSELETVYEEKNMYSDNMAVPAFQAIMKEYFGDAPYSCPIIGTTENLKHPQLSSMNDFYRKYYVPRNMAVILCGDVNTEQVRPILENSFGRLEDMGEAPKRSFDIEPLRGQRKIQFKLPVPLLKFAGAAFSAPKADHPDYIPLKIAIEILSNDSHSGLLDSLVNVQKALMASAVLESFDDASFLAFGTAPNIPFGSEKKAMKMCREQIEKLKQGHFSDAMLSEIKDKLYQNAIRSIETPESRGNMLMSTFTRGRTWEEELNSIERYREVTREEVIEVANKYFNDNYIEGHKVTGTYPKDKVEQPDYKPVAPKNAHASSAYADSLKRIPASYVPKCVNFKNDVAKTEIAPGFTLYSVENPLNDIFDMKIIWTRGSGKDRTLSALPSYLESVGTDSLSLHELNKTLRRLGAGMSFSSDRRTFSVSLSARDSQMEPLLELVRHFINHVAENKSVIRDMISDRKMGNKSFDEDNSAIADAMLDYVLWGGDSDCLRQLSVAEIKKLGAKGMVESFKEVVKSPFDVVYSGKIEPGKLVSLVRKYIDVTEDAERIAEDRKFEALLLKDCKEPLVYIYNMPSSRQNIIMTCQRVDDKTNAEDKAKARLFSKYFGSGMYSVLFQELREFRSFAYNANGYHVMSSGNLPECPAAFVTYVGTQSDKTVAVLETLDSLYKNMPVREENAETAKLGLINEINNSYPSFRSVAGYVRNREALGFAEDPDIELAERLPSMGMADIEEYFNTNIKDRPQVLIIVGNKKKLPMELLRRYGEIIELKKSDIYRY